MKDPFEAAVEEQESPPESPAAQEEEATVVAKVYGGGSRAPSLRLPPLSGAGPSGSGGAALAGRGKQPRLQPKEPEEEDDDEEDHMEVDLDKLPSGSSDPDKLAKMNAILSQFTEEQMNRYESFRRSGFQKSNMRKVGPHSQLSLVLLASITGSQKISHPTTIVVSGIAKMFVARIVMTERKDSGPIRPCHIREAFRRLKLEGKIPRRTVPRLFR
uniref:TAFII28-like protein domain-containing protein n=1 Tax=Leersia perrieri TaxID=77586 RepID=A0A0D9XZP9_9ORYZ